MYYILVVEDLNTNDTYTHKENGKVVRFVSEFQAVGAKYALLEQKAFADKRLTVEFRRDR